MVKFRCGDCDQKIGVPDAYNGRMVRCPACGAPTRVTPTLGDENSTVSPEDEVLNLLDGLLPPAGETVNDFAPEEIIAADEAELAAATEPVSVVSAGEECPIQRYRVLGFDPEVRLDVISHVSAQSPEEAAVKAGKLGLHVKKVAPEAVV